MSGRLSGRMTDSRLRIAQFPYSLGPGRAIQRLIPHPIRKLWETTATLPDSLTPQWNPCARLPEFQWAEDR